MLTKQTAGDAETKVVPARTKHGGRTKGTPNKNTKELKNMILEALDKSGGVTYLAKQAKENPKAFMTLLGRVLPLQVTGEGGGPVQITFSQSDADL